MWSQLFGTQSRMRMLREWQSLHELSSFLIQLLIRWKRMILVDPVGNTVSLLLRSGREGQPRWNATLLHFYSGAGHFLEWEGSSCYWCCCWQNQYCIRFLWNGGICVCEVGTVGKISDCQPRGPGFNPWTFERGWTLGDLLSPHRPWTGTLSRWSRSLDVLSGDLKEPTHLSIRVG